MTVYYLDSSATYNGDGSTYTQATGAGQPGALNTLVGKVFAANDIIWARRSNTAMVLSAIYTGNLNNVSLYGWPLSTDDHYGIRPSDPQATWDGDSAQFFKITTSSAVNYFNPSIPPSIIRRLWVDSTIPYNNGTGFSNALINLVGNNLDVRYIQSTCSNFLPTGTTSFGPMFSIVGINPTVRDIYVKGSMTANYNLITIASNGNGGYVNNITIDAMKCANGYLVGFSGCLGFQSAVGSVHDLVAESITINILDPTNGNLHSIGAFWIYGGTCRIYDITVNNAYTGNTYMGPCVSINSGSDNSQIIGLKTTGSMGQLYINSQNCLVEITNWNALYPLNSTAASSSPGINNYPLILNNTNLSKVIINNGTLNTSGSGAKPIYNTGGNGNTIVLNNVLTNVSNGMVVNTTNLTTLIISTNHNKNANVLHIENKYGTLDSSNVYRTGGFGLSLKASGILQRLGQNARNVPYSPKGNELQNLLLNIGTNTITLYGCYTNWSGSIKALPDCRDVGFSFTYIDNNGIAKLVNTYSDSPLPSDTSTWNNDTGLTIFKISVTVNVAVQQIVAISIYSSLNYDANGRFYFEPIVYLS